MMLKFLKPVIGTHDGSSFREMMDLWREFGLCYVQPNVIVNPSPLPDDLKPEARIWYNEVGDVLLYDQTILDRVPEKWNYGLFANDVFHSDKSCAWIFWQRWPRQYRQFLDNNDILSYEDRKIETSFIGNMTTPKRMEYNWKIAIEYYTMGSMNNNPKGNMLLSYDDYMKVLQQSKFGVCLPGQGPKCLRDAETMGFGTVPIMTPGVSTKYYNEIKENKHYIYASNPEDLKRKVYECSKEQWEYMSHECKKWFEENCSVEGTFNTTKKILEDKDLIR